MSQQEDSIWKAINTTSDRVTDLEGTIHSRNERMREAIQIAVREAMPSALLTDEEHKYVQLAIEKQAQSIEFRRAVIDKTLTGLIWAAIIGLGAIFREYAISHGMWKP